MLKRPSGHSTFSAQNSTFTLIPTGTLLIIEDEARLRQLLAQVLEREGYTVLQSPDAHRGPELLRQPAASVVAFGTARRQAG